MIYILTLVLLFSSSAQAFNSEAFQINEQRAPYLLQIMIKHLSVHYSQADLNQEELFKQLTNLNLNAQSMPQNELVFLTHFEINQAILNYKLKQGYQSNTISSTDISELNSKIKKFKELYSDLCLYILTESIADFSTFISENKLDRLQTKSTQNQADIKKKNELKSLIKYSGKWINTAISLTPQEFNRVVSLTILPALKSLNASLLSFKNYIQPDMNFNKVEILPQLALINQSSTSVPKSESSPQKVLKSIEPDIPANPEKEIDQIFEKKLDSDQE